MNLQGAWDKVKDLGYNPYYLGLYGSQNYGIDTEKSDFDYKCIILPTLEDLVNNTKPVSISVEFEGGLIDIKDIRTYVSSAVKVNVNFIEILSTDYFLGDKYIRTFYEKLLTELGQQYLRALKGMAMEKLHALEKEYPSTKDKIDKYGYDSKQLCHIVRLSYLANRYLYGDFNLKHTGEEKEYLLKIKSNYFSLEQARIIANQYISEIDYVCSQYKKEDTYISKNELIKFSNNEIIKSITSNILGTQ